MKKSNFKEFTDSPVKIILKDYCVTLKSEIEIQVEAENEEQAKNEAFDFLNNDFATKNLFCDSCNVVSIEELVSAENINVKL